MSLKLNSSGGGSVTVQEPTTASNRTLSIPDATTTVVGTDATQTLSNKTFSGATTFGTASMPEPNGSTPLYSSRAWVNFNGTGTVAIRSSGNVSSITDNGTGDYTVNFSTAMSDTNYCVVGMRDYGVNDNGKYSMILISSITTSAFRFAIVNPGVNVYDSAYVQLSAFR